MRNFIIKSIFLLFATISFEVLQAQQVTFEDLIKLNSEKASNAAQFVPQVNRWHVQSRNISNSDSAMVILRTDFKSQDADKANHWISIYSEDDIPKTVSYQTTNKDYIDKILDELETAGFILSGSKITDQSNSSTYAKDKLSVEIFSFFSETSPGKVYLVTVKS